MADSTKQLTEQRIIEIMREEWESKRQRLDDDLRAFMNVKDDGEKKGIIGVDTKIRHKATDLLYTVANTGPRDITLKYYKKARPGREPEPPVFITISQEEFEEEYELD